MQVSWLKISSLLSPIWTLLHYFLGPCWGKRVTRFAWSSEGEGFVHRATGWMSCLRPLCMIRWNGEDMLAIYQSKGWLLKGEEIQTQLLEGDQFPETPWRAMLDFWVQPKALLRSGRDPCPIRSSVARERVFTSLLSSMYCRQMNLETTGSDVSTFGQTSLSSAWLRWLLLSLLFS